MEPLEVNELYSIEEIIDRQDTDNNKYIFEYNMDIAYDELDEATDGPLLHKYWEEENHDKFVELYNKHFTTNTFKVLYISVMKGPGGGWPDATITTTKPMTIKEFIKEMEEEMNDTIDDFLCDVTISKVIEA
jgi:hypothetical protein